MRAACKASSAEITTIDTNVDSILADVEILGDHIHGACEVYPKNNGVAPFEAGVSLPCGGVGAGVFGVATEILPAVATAREFDIHWINMEVLPANATYELVLYNGATEIGRVRFARLNNNEAVNGVPFMMNRVPAGTAITAKCCNSANDAGNLVISVFYHQY